MSDEAFHEIQLNGKQLVFLFMAATVVSVVIFLCGVMVGRGVPTAGASQVAALASETLDPTVAAQAPLPASAASVAAADDAPISAQETLTYTSRLEDPNPAEEKLKAPAVSRASVSDGMPEPAAEPSEPIARAAVPLVPAAVPAVAPPTAPAVATTIKAPSGNGFVVQVAAVNERTEADTIARRLAGKGYPAFVTTPGGAVRVFRVRVGTYNDRRDAESVAGRLEKEEQFKPWITR